jgi:hypothetical protein
MEDRIAAMMAPPTLPIDDGTVKLRGRRLAVACPAISSSTCHETVTIEQRHAATVGAPAAPHRRRPGRTMLGTANTCAHGVTPRGDL